MRAWDGRFDDPKRSFATLYVAETPHTAASEVFAPLRPDAVTLVDFRKKMGFSIGAPVTGGVVEMGDYGDKRLVGMNPALAGPLWDLTDPGVRSRVAGDFPEVLAAHGVPHLDGTDVLTRDRAFTQDLAAAAYASGQSGVRYASNVGDGACLALFEGCYDITARTTPLELKDDAAFAVIAWVCDQLGLRLTPKIT